MSYELVSWLLSAVIAVAIVAAMFGYYILKDYLISRYGKAARLAREEARSLDTGVELQPIIAKG